MLLGSRSDVLSADEVQYLADQHYILSQDWMPFENMLIPLMLFRREVKSFDQMSEEQRAFVEYWYWASIFANRYSSASNEVIIADATALVQVAHGEKISARGFFARLRPLVTESDDLFAYTKRSSAIYRGVLNLLGYAVGGLRDWNNTQQITTGMQLEDHHIYPRAYIASATELDLDAGEAEQLVDCVVNRTLIPKLTNLHIGKKAPQTYLSELQVTNQHLVQCLPDHLIPADLITDSEWNYYFKTFLEERATAIFDLIGRYAIAPAAKMTARHSMQAEDTAQVEAGDTSPTLVKARLVDLIAAGKVALGERVYVRRRPDRPATIVDGETVLFEGKYLPINQWGQQLTGWKAINIYEMVYLEKTNAPLKLLR